MLGASWEPEFGSGLGKGLLTGVRGEVGESEGSIVTDRVSYRKALFVSSFGLDRVYPNAERQTGYRSRVREVCVRFDSWRQRVGWNEIQRRRNCMAVVGTR